MILLSIGTRTFIESGNVNEYIVLGLTMFHGSIALYISIISFGKKAPSDTGQLALPTEQ
jgi:hypothetical protein